MRYYAPPFKIRISYFFNNNKKNLFFRLQFNYSFGYSLAPVPKNNLRIVNGVPYHITL